MVKRAAIIVAHPDDETLWAGGTILVESRWRWHVAVLCRGGDPDRAPRFLRVLKRLNATGAIADLDDGPAQRPLDDALVQDTILSLLPNAPLDLVLTHGPRGEYTKHLRHEETSRAVSSLWRQGRLEAAELWMFAYEDGGGLYLPRAAGGAHERKALPDDVWKQKIRIITELYGFSQDSFEARAAPREEAFWKFASPGALDSWLQHGELRHEGAGPL